MEADLRSDDGDTKTFPLCFDVRLQVKELYRGVLGALQPLHPPRLFSEERVGEGYERMRREVEKEVERRKAVASQLRTLLDNQLQVHVT